MTRVVYTNTDDWVYQHVAHTRRGTCSADNVTRMSVIVPLHYVHYNPTSVVSAMRLSASLPSSPTQRAALCAAERPSLCVRRMSHMESRRNY